MSPTITELSMCFSHCHCLSHFLVFKHFQIIKICYYCPSHSGFWRDERKLLWHRKKKCFVLICFCSESKLSFCNHKLLKQRQTYAERHHFFQREMIYKSNKNTLKHSPKRYHRTYAVCLWASGFNNPPVLFYPILPHVRCIIHRNKFTKFYTYFI